LADFGWTKNQLEGLLARRLSPGYQAIKSILRRKTVAVALKMWRVARQKVYHVSDGQTGRQPLFPPRHNIAHSGVTDRAFHLLMPSLSLLQTSQPRVYPCPQNTHHRLKQDLREMAHTYILFHVYFTDLKCRSVSHFHWKKSDFKIFFLFNNLLQNTKLCIQAYKMISLNVLQSHK